MKRSGSRLVAGLAILPAVLITLSCAALKTSQPILPIRDYERLLAGPLDADYIGNDKCLKACHDHDQVNIFLRESVHGSQVESGTGMPLVNCETCHGPGSQAVARATEDKKCDTKKFVQIKELPAGARSLICLKCHSSHSMGNMQYWSASQHAQAEVACSDCHKLHKSPHQKLGGEEINELCYGCHPQARFEFSLFSRHPLKEGKMSCATCHDPHGSINESNLSAPDIKGVCIGCHADRIGPFVFEHGDLMDDCSQCHQPHGSPFGGLLRYQEPFLCLGCHSGHGERGRTANPTEGYKRAIYTKCTNCHPQIHGSDQPGDTTPGSVFIY